MQRARNKSLQVVLNDRKDHNTQEHRLLHLLMVWLDQNGRLLSMVENLFLSCESIAFQSQVSKALICPANFNVASCFEMCHPSRRDNLLTLVVLCPHLEREIKHFDYTLCKVPSLTQGSTLQEMADDRCISKTFHRRTLNILNRYLLLTLHFHKTKVQLLVCCATSAHHP